MRKKFNFRFYALQENKSRETAITAGISRHLPRRVVPEHLHIPMLFRRQYMVHKFPTRAVMITPHDIADLLLSSSSWPI